jgi:MFS family permease
MLRQIIFEFLSDRFGRKKIIVIKILAALVFVVTLIFLGLIGNIMNEAVIAMYFISLFFATFTLELVAIGFESVIKENREIILSSYQPPCL